MTNASVWGGGGGGGLYNQRAVVEKKDRGASRGLSSVDGIILWVAERRYLPLFSHEALAYLFGQLYEIASLV